MFKVNNRKTQTRCEICPKLTIKIPEQRRSGIFIVNFEHISHLVQVFLLLTLSRLIPAGIMLSMFKVNCALMLFSSQHVTFHPITPSVHKMVRRTLKIL